MRMINLCAGLVADGVASQQKPGGQVHVFTEDQVGRKAARLPQGREPVGGKRVGQKTGFEAFVEIVLRGYRLGVNGLAVQR